jgi:hypothetical protein
MSCSFFGRRRYVLLVPLAALWLAGVPTAFADETSAVNKVVDLNRRALKTYDELDMETALKLLKQAIELCNLEGLQRHRAAARTHIHMGVVYSVGLKMREQALAEFRRAIGIDPTIRVTKSVSSPEVEAIFAEAVANGGDVAAPLPQTEPQPIQVARPVAPARPGPAREPVVNHPPVTEAVIGKPVEIKAQLPKSIHAEKVVLAYRAGNDGEFLAREMQPIVNAPEWYHQKIPADVVESQDLHYYIEAQDDDGQPLLASGSAAAPHVIKVIREAPEAVENVSGGGAGKEGGGHPFWLVLAVGAGAGYFSGAPEMNAVDDKGSSLKASGTGMAKLGHVAPELGLFLTEHVLLSVQGRVQLVTGSADVTYGGRTYQTTKTAIAGLAKLSYFLTEPTARLQPFLTLHAGVGEIRYPVRTTPLLGCGQNGSAGACKDTVRGGLGLFGAGVGFIYMLGESLGAYASLGGLVGAPDFAVDADVSLGFAVVR